MSCIVFPPVASCVNAANNVTGFEPEMRTASARTVQALALNSITVSSVVLSVEIVPVNFTDSSDGFEGAFSC